MSKSNRLPDYAPMLADFHTAFPDEIRAKVDDLPIRPGDQILELASGDGAYSRLLADRAGSTGSVTSVDVTTAFLRSAKDAGDHSRRPLGLVQADVERLPFADDSFDFVWCAQSLYSLPDPARVVATMRRVVRPGGFAAVLENDSLHHVLLPWPVEVELAVRMAEHDALSDQVDNPDKFYVGRRLRSTFREAGLVDVRQRSYVTNRQSPLQPAERGFLAGYLDELRGRTLNRLSHPLRDDFDRLTRPGSGDHLLDDPGLVVTLIDHVVTGQKPAESRFD